MSRRVVVRVPGRAENGVDVIGRPVLTLSATVDDITTSEPTIECLGTLADEHTPSGSSAILAGLNAVCIAANCEPGGVHVRASSLAPHDAELDDVAVAAGAAAGNALLGLGLSDLAVARIARDVWGVSVPIDRCSVVVHNDCED